MSPHPHSGDRPAQRNVRAFTLVELQLSVAIFVIGLLGLSALMTRQSRQMRQAENWCASSPTFYAVSQTNKWMRRLEAPAALETQAGQTSWTPSVTGTQQFQVQLLSVQRNLDAQTGSAGVNMVEVP